jgi:hypothetical protein
VEALLQREGAIPLDRAVRLVRDTALGLQAALAKGIVHRDVKPSNLLVSGTGSVKIVDFGLAKELGGKNSMTAEGIVLGTPHYISPEQGRGRAVDHRSDIYSLGATFYNLVTGKPPFEGTSQVSVIVAHVNEPLAPPHELRAGIPETASRVILRMMAKSPDGRYPTYAELVEDLDLLLEGKEPRHAGAGVTTALLPRPAPARRRRAGPVLAAAAAVILLSGAAFLLLGGPPTPSQVETAALGRWHVKLDDGRDVLDMDFAEPPGGRSGAETWRRLVLPPAELPADAALPHISGKSLRWDGFTSPFACGLPFERIDEVLVSIGTTTGSFDLGIAIVDPSGASVRSLLLALRPAEVTERPLATTLHGEEAGGAALPPVPRLGQGPYDVTMTFRPGPSSTAVRVTIARRPSGRTVYDAACDVQGTDWASGVLVLLTPSPVKPFSVAIDRARITGVLSGDALEDVPWRA